MYNQTDVAASVQDGLQEVVVRVALSHGFGPQAIIDVQQIVRVGLCIATQLIREWSKNEQIIEKK